MGRKKAMITLLNELVEIDARTAVESVVKKILQRALKYRNMWKSLIVHVLNGQGT